MRYWDIPSTQQRYYWSPSHVQADPIEIETASYVLLTYFQKNDFLNGMSVMKWLTTQRNGNGGFASTQVTFKIRQKIYSETCPKRTLNKNPKTSPMDVCWTCSAIFCQLFGLICLCSFHRIFVSSDDPPVFFLCLQFKNLEMCFFLNFI